MHILVGPTRQNQNGTGATRPHGPEEGAVGATPTADPMQTYDPRTQCFRIRPND